MTDQNHGDPKGEASGQAENLQLIATSTVGLESVTARELTRLGYSARHSATEVGRTYFSGGPADLVRTNLWLRTAGKILVELARFEVGNDFDVLFSATEEIPWEAWIPHDAAILVEGRSVRSKITSVPALQRTVKKGIVNRLTKVHHLFRLPETGPTVTVEISLLNDRAVLTLDSTGRGLHRRGYRTMNVAVPLRETLAAALVQLSVWNPSRPLIDPFCASGTIPIEAAMIGRNIAPGLKRSFAAEDWPIIPSNLWRDARDEATAAIHPSLPVKIIGADIDAESLRLARFHAHLAGVADDILFRQADFRDLNDQRHYGCVIGNPPYGDRVGEREEFRSLYESIPAVLSKLPTWSHYLITSWTDLEEIVGRQADRRRKLYNSRLECCYYQFLGPRPPKGWAGNREPDERNNGQVEETPELANNFPAETEKFTEETIVPAFAGPDDTTTRQVEEFGRCLTNRAKHLARYPKRGITCYRLYDRDFPEVPLAVDLFEGKWLHLAEYERPDGRSPAAHRLWLDALADKAREVLHIEPENLFLKRRRPQRGGIQYEKFAETGQLVEVHEGEFVFLCNMTDYLDVGLFLDHRKTREMVRREAVGKRFLNLFCYTGSFTVAAGIGGAVETVSTDLSATYLDWAERNLKRNGLDVGDQTANRLVRSDAIDFLQRLPEATREKKNEEDRPLKEKGGRRETDWSRSDFDLCVCDPPTYSNSKSLEEDWDVQKRHVELLRLLATRMTRGGVVYFSNNFRRFHLDEEALADLYSIREISRQTVPEEYRNRRIHQCWRLIVR